MMCLFYLLITLLMTNELKFSYILITLLVTMFSILVTKSD
jgi:hypothetical protein